MTGVQTCALPIYTMLTSHINFSLKDLNTFGIDVLAAQYLECTTVDSLKEAISISNEINENR